eukprot:gene31366-6528_t
MRSKALAPLWGDVQVGRDREAEAVLQFGLKLGHGAPASPQSPHDKGVSILEKGVGRDREAEAVLEFGLELGHGAPASPQSPHDKRIFILEKGVGRDREAEAVLEFGLKLGHGAPASPQSSHDKGVSILEKGSSPYCKGVSFLEERGGILLMSIRISSDAVWTAAWQQGPSEPSELAMLGSLNPRGVEGRAICIHPREGWEERGETDADDEHEHKDKQYCTLDCSLATEP